MSNIKSIQIDPLDLDILLRALKIASSSQEATAQDLNNDLARQARQEAAEMTRLYFQIAALPRSGYLNCTITAGVPQ